MILKHYAGAQQDDQGRWFETDASGRKTYNPTTADRPDDTFFKTGVFDTATGQWGKKTNWNNVIGLGALAGIAAPAAVAGVGALGGAAGAAGSSGAAASTAAPVAAGKGLMAGIGIWGPILNAGINGVASIYGTHAQSSATKQAGAVQAKAAADALAFSREQEAERVREYNQEQATAKAAWEADQSRRAPFRETAQNALVRLSQLTGLQAPALAQAQPTMGAPTPSQPNMLTLAQLAQMAKRPTPYLTSGSF